MKTKTRISAYNFKTKQSTKYETITEAANHLGLNEPDVYKALNKRQIVGDYSFTLETIEDRTQ